MKIKKITGSEILDSRGNPTIKVYLETTNGVFTSSVPSGASTGMYEAVELRDGGNRYLGKGVQKAIKNINTKISPALKGMDVKDQEKIDQRMIKLDGTKNKSVLGGNAIVGVSLAVCRAGASFYGLPLYKYISKLSGRDIKMPRPLFNVINGGAHASNDLDFQEFMISPRKKKYNDILEAASVFYHQLKKTIKKKYGATGVGDEGGFAPDITTPEEALNLISKTEGDVDIVLDVAASSFFKKKYITKMGSFNSNELIKYYQKLIKKYPIIAIEDPLDENDWEGFISATEKLVTIVGDDLLVTNPEKIAIALEKKACNGMIIKINQIGTVTEALQAVAMAQENKWTTIVSHRSGETDDDFIADFSVGIASDYIKTGAPARGERVVKYNRLLEIYEENFNCR
jgi:enolase